MSDSSRRCPQGSWLGPVLIVTAINNLQLHACTLHKYMDDTTITKVLGANEKSNMSLIMPKLMDWSQQTKMCLNPKKTKEMIISFGASARLPESLIVDNAAITRVDTCKLLGMHIQSNLKWDTHITEIMTKAARRMYFLSCLRRAGVKADKLRLYYIACIRSLIEYGSVIYHPGLTKKQSADLESLQRRAMHIINDHDAPNNTVVKLIDRRIVACNKLFDEMTSPSHKLHHLLPPVHNRQYNLRRQRKFVSTNAKNTKRYNSEFVNYCINNFNMSS